MHGTDVRETGAVRTTARAAAGQDGHDDTAGFQPAVPGNGRGALRTGLARMAGVVPANGPAELDSGSVFRRGQHPSGARRADGGAVGTDGSNAAPPGPRFDLEVAPSGYAWWYLDAVSDDGQQGLTVIAFLGSVFSPYYAWARHKGAADPMNHCAINVALYGPRNKQWAMTERPANAVRRDPASLVIGPSSLEWTRGKLIVDVNERTMPWMQSVRGRITLTPEALPGKTWTLAESGAHWWSPIAPVARITVDFNQPSTSWSGNAYLDSNGGAGPLEDTFVDWDWSRAPHRDGTAALYDVRRRDGSTDSLALRFSKSGQVETLEPPAEARLPMTRWRVRRGTRSDTGAARIGKTLEDTPFYARSLVHTTLFGENTVAMHESLSLDRFASPVVQAMLPFRMPRVRS